MNLQNNNKYAPNFLIVLLELNKNLKQKSEILLPEINFDEVEMNLQNEQYVSHQENIIYGSQPEFLMELKVLCQGKNSKNFKYDIGEQGMLIPNLRPESQNKIRWNDVCLVKSLNFYFNQVLTLQDYIKTQIKSHDLYKQTFYSIINQIVNQIFLKIDEFQIDTPPIFFVSQIQSEISDKIKILLLYAQDIQELNISGIDILMYLIQQNEIIGNNEFEQTLEQKLKELMFQQVQQFISTNTLPTSFPCVDNKQINEQGNRYQMIQLQYKNKQIIDIIEKTIQIKNQLNYIQTVCKVTVDFNQFKEFQEFIRCTEDKTQNIKLLQQNLDKFLIFSSQQLKSRLLETFKLMDVFKLIGQVFFIKNVQFIQQFSQVAQKQFTQITAENEIDFILQNSIKNVNQKTFSNIKVTRQVNQIELELNPVELSMIFNKQFNKQLTQFQNLYLKLIFAQNNVQKAVQMYKKEQIIKNVMQQKLLSDTCKLIQNLQQNLTMDLISQFNEMTEKFNTSKQIIKDSIKTVDELMEVLRQIENKYEKLINQTTSVILDFTTSLMDKTKYIDINSISINYLTWMQEHLQSYRKESLGQGVFL